MDWYVKRPRFTHPEVNLTLTVDDPDVVLDWCKENLPKNAVKRVLTHWTGSRYEMHMGLDDNRNATMISLFWSSKPE